MNVSELARQLRVNTKDLLELLPQYGFDIGAKSIKIDDKVAEQVTKRWRFIKRDIEEKRKREAEEKKQKERELRKEMGQTVRFPARITVREFAGRLNLPTTQVIMELMKNGILANQNQDIDYETAAIIAEELGFTVEKEVGGQAATITEDTREEHLEAALAQGTERKPRAPVIVVMGHVDHGKTKLLDTIRHANIIATESGGITQHIGAYQTIWKDPKTGAERALTFIDTPGHEAFTVMRSRGARVADIAILVVAADDGVQPQTVEVIQIIRAAKLPLVVAINKIDKDTADVQKVKTQLSQQNVLPEEWAGDVPMIEISAKSNLHIDKLLDVLLLVADMHGEEIQADSTIPAVGTIIESHVDKGMGPVATVLVHAGTLHKNDALVVNGEIYGKVRAMKDHRGGLLDEAGPSVPVQIIGFKVAPVVGDILDVARAAGASKIDVKQKKSQQTGAEQRSIVEVKREEEEGEAKKTINILIKADVLGSLEAIIGSLEKFRHDEVAVKIVGKGLGNITEDDVRKAEAVGASILGFHVNTTSTAEEQMREKNIAFLRFEVIYDLLDWVKAELKKLLSVERTVTEIGRMKVLAIFRRDKNGMIVGGRVEDGKVVRDSLARVKREGVVMGTGKIAQCKVGQADVKEAVVGTECGVKFEGREKIEEGDVLEMYTEETREREIVFG